MIALLASFVLAMQATPLDLPSPIAIPTPASEPSDSLSERGMLEQRLDRIVADAKARTGGQLGVVVWDLGTNVLVQRNAETAFPLAGVLRLPVAYAAYVAVDHGRITLDQAVAVQPSDLVATSSPIAQAYAAGPHAYSVRELIDRMLIDGDATATDVLYRVLGGADGINAALRQTGIEAMFIRTNTAGTIADAKSGRTFARGGDNAASPAAIGLLLAGFARDQFLSKSSRTALLEALGRVNAGPGRLRAGLPGGAWFAHLIGTSAAIGDTVDVTSDVGITNMNRRHVVVIAMLQGAHGTQAQREAVLADVARAAYDATKLFSI